MSLLLDALRPAESNYAAADEPQAEDPQEEPLDARATLDLLAPKAAPDALALAPATAPDVATPHEIADVAPVATPYARAPLSLAAKIPEPALGRREPPAPAPGSRGTAAVAGAAQSNRNYGLLLAVLAVLVGLGLIGKLLWPKTNAVSYPEGSESMAPAAAPATPDPGTAPGSLQAVQVPSARPVDQFAYTGNAPEIDLHEAQTPPSAIRKPATPSGEVPKPPAAPRAAAALSVTRSESESSIDRHVQAGYLALVAGNVPGAQSEYLAALNIDANNVDALLGAAAAAARDGKPAVATAAYAKVLKLEPGNPDATAAIAMLKPDAAASESNESHLKILIANDDGNRPALHAALAGVYGGDGRWAEAAQEYFTALAKDPGNPDLAFDVAASLDQNRNAAMALNFYQQALAFALSRPAQFDPKAVEQRIGQLQAHSR